MKINESRSLVFTGSRENVNALYKHLKINKRNI